MSAQNSPIHTDITILFVEDEPATREQVSRVLATLGYHLVVAENGKEGLDSYIENPADIILTDIMMPKMNGLEMARRIRAISSDAQIVCMTAFSDTSDLIEAIEIGVNQFVLKPVEFSHLLTALDRCREVIELKKRHRNLEAEKLRARKMEAIGILAGGMAHDFNNLLQVILGYVSLARMNAEPGSKTFELLGIAENASETARELGKRLLIFAKGGDAHTQTTDIKPLIRTAIDEELSGSGVNYSIEMQENLPPLRVDIEQIKQVFAQLAANAREAMHQGGLLRISASTISISREDSLPIEPGEYLHIVFEDSGVGIKPEDLPNIFDPYFTTKEMGCQKGMGLGLALSHSIIRHHKGQILAESTPGEGTLMHIYLPVSAP
ncbi:MAG: response regulator [Desulfuromonadaceae bacterium]|nr:response regulator [Desulfuromonadaceae bacterium]